LLIVSCPSRARKASVLKRLSALVLTLSAALYVGCSPTGNQETGKGDLGITPSGSVAAFEIAADRPRVPTEDFTDSDGDDVSLRDFRGRVVLLNLWATWCGPCRHEMPSLDRLQAQQGGDDFVVITLSSDRGEARAVEPFFDEYGIDALTAYYDPMNAMGRALDVRGLPTTLLVDREGREIGRLEGPAEWDSPEALALIDAARKL